MSLEDSLLHQRAIQFLNGYHGRFSSELRAVSQVSDLASKTEQESQVLSEARTVQKVNTFQPRASPTPRIISDLSSQGAPDASSRSTQPMATSNPDWNSESPHNSLHPSVISLPVLKPFPQEMSVGLCCGTKGRQEVKPLSGPQE